MTMIKIYAKKNTPINAKKNTQQESSSISTLNLTLKEVGLALLMKKVK